ncbi:MAG: histidinol-phosphatase [Treponema sp.]|jgi:hypothetical protein|nr:histidinol-phosphatase [Treponema sp.]
MFLYETHLHTVESSACGVSPGADYIQPYLDRGFTGIMVTDHFFNSNCVADRRLPWAEWVKRYCAGFENAREEGARRGLDVFFGWEETFDGDDYLIYGLDKEWLLEHPEMVRWTREEQFREVRRYGGCVVHAHPFRQHYYIHTVHLAPYCIDAVEAANAGNNDPAYDALGLEYARILGLPAVAGSDIHDAEDLKTAEPYGVGFAEKLTSINDYVRILLRGRGAGENPTILHIPEGRCAYRKAAGEKPLKCGVDIIGRDGRPLGGKIRPMSFNDITGYLGRFQNQP